MAGCYHDKQDIKSNLNIEVARESDILQEGQDLKDIKCNKNPGHEDFIPFKDLTLEHLPDKDRKTEVLEKIKKMGNLVVRLVVNKIKNGRCIKDAGTGYVFKSANEYFIQTNNHVVKTDDEVKHCTVEFHYDDDSRVNVLTSRGVELVKTCPYRDVTAFRFHPVPEFLHQVDFMDDKLPSIVIKYKNNQISTEVTYPYYNRSELKFYSLLNLNSSLIDLMYVSLPDGSISSIKSLYFKFQPIPSNIQELTSIEIHIDEDSRVIPGDVVKFGDEFVVKISESIFQDDVKKCKLVWNGEVIGFGSRLYFEQTKSSDELSGIDLEERIEQGKENNWVFECHPISRDLKRVHRELLTKQTNHVCCIGHPHGGIKMITFGRWLGTPSERFDNKYRRIPKTEIDCKCKVVNCFKYTCKTCCGSSGSPILELYEGMDWSVSYTHFMGQRIEPIEDFLPNGERMENINMAWCSRIHRDLILE